MISIAWQLSGGQGGDCIAEGVVDGGSPRLPGEVERRLSSLPMMEAMSAKLGIPRVCVGTTMSCGG